MREYKYKAIFEKDGVRIVWNGRAANKKEFVRNAIELVDSIDKGWALVSARKAPPEFSRPRKYYSFACVDMGQAF